MSRNPYDRRGMADQHLMGYRDGVHVFDGRPRINLQIEDLNAMATSAMERGHRDAVEDLSSRHMEELQAARREAWEQGHTAGVAEGIEAAVGSFLRQFVPRLAGLDQELRLTQQEAEKDERRVTKQRLMTLVRDMQVVVGSVLRGAERQFRPE